MGLHLENVFSAICGLAVEHPWHVSFRVTEGQLPVNAPLARALCKIEQVLREVLLRFTLTTCSATKLNECGDSILWMTLLLQT